MLGVGEAPQLCPLPAKLREEELPAKKREKTRKLRGEYERGIEDRVRVTKVRESREAILFLLPFASFRVFRGPSLSRTHPNSDADKCLRRSDDFSVHLDAN